MSYLQVYGQTQNLVNPATQYVAGLELYGGFRKFQNLGFYGQLASGSFFTTPNLPQYTWWETFPFAPSNQPNLYRDFVSYPALNPGSGLSYGPDITFTRASSATFTGSNGLIQYASANQPRFDYDPTTLKCQGFLIESNRTNLLLYSEQLNTVWGGNLVTVVPNATISPDGSLTADKLTSTGTDAYLAQNVVGTATQTFTGSVWLRADAPVTFYIQFSDSTLGVSNTACSVTTTWKRFSVKRTLPIGATSVNFVFGGGSTFTTGQSVYAWGVQTELGAFPTSYIPTTSATVTRSADVAAVAGSNFNAIYNPNEGSVYAEFQNQGGVQTGFPACPYTLQNDFGYACAGTSMFLFRPAGTNTSGTITGLTDGTFYKSALSYTKTSAVEYLAGQLDITSTSPQTVESTGFGIGCSSVNGQGGNGQLNNHLAVIAYFPRALANGNLQALTA